MEENIKHVQLPTVAVRIKKLRPSEILTYVTIRRYMNKDTKECNPSQETIANKAGISKPSVGKAIKVLVANNLIKVRKVPNPNGKQGVITIYTFLEANEDGFEMFSFDFLDRDDLTPQEKAAICLQQSFMIKDPIKKEGNIYYSEKRMTQELGVSQQWLNKQNKSLENKGMVTITHDRDEITGMVNNIRHFQLSKLDQAFVCILKNHDERIKSNEDDIEQLKKQNEELLKRITALENAHTYTM